MLSAPHQSAHACAVGVLTDKRCASSLTGGNQHLPTVSKVGVYVFHETVSRYVLVARYVHYAIYLHRDAPSAANKSVDVDLSTVARACMGAGAILSKNSKLSGVEADTQTPSGRRIQERRDVVTNTTEYKQRLAGLAPGLSFDLAIADPHSRQVTTCRCGAPLLLCRLYCDRCLGSSPQASACDPSGRRRPAPFFPGVRG